MSPNRRPVEYNAVTDSFESVSRDDSLIKEQRVFPESEMHTVFGDTFWLLKFLEM